MTTAKAAAVNLRLALCLAALLVFAGLARAELVGQVVGIMDGDTIDVLVHRQPVRVRLAQIDAPEKQQAFGTRSRQALAELVFRQTVTVDEVGRDRYGRVIGTVYLSGMDVNAQMVRDGMAWVYRQYAKDSVLFELERQAQADKRGLWADPDPVAPWEYRHNKLAQAALPN